MKKTVVVLRNGEAKLIGVTLDERADGTLWMPNGKGALLDGECKDISRERMATLAKAGKWDELPASAYLKIGTSASGAMVMLLTEWRAAKQHEEENYLEQHPEVKERNRISALYDRARRRLDDRDDNNTSDHYRLLAEADAALEAWRAKYPEAAKEERRQAILSEAEHEEQLASGALTYDADGWYDEAQRQKHHDEYMAKARELREQAANL